MFTTTPHAVNTPLKIYIGGVAATILYAGSSGYPGLDQLDVTIPENAPLSCSTGVVAVTGTGASATVSNFGSLATSASGGDCNDSTLRSPGHTIASLSGLSTVRDGSLFIAQLFCPRTPGPVR